ncbi:MAG: hypothetical protein COU10_02465 [Candidatus Harrisonbacteria bacterium CG10_big_fil_rev_8_21_14_0_10_45_28]|uniref:DUF4325 domain-containing protein n=1 Tax=Candidatus Harrisonbacteria bacterium CG10_big_fil_rev_8_21_14_0_10_45_28 TaxID=1974586 RepID=A0A2H0UQ87_9BACT|nr:MAG: hypothetical protein COU10_02465 [Candidatus Harrisonbacteria bacterium CG10_big_fil_rev_8_21_14_0_10_45_28]
MIIQLKKFGDTLVSRDAGKEALAAFRPTLNTLSPEEKVQIDFSGIFTLSPSWASEFILALQNEYGSRVELMQSDNAAVQATLQFLKEINEK